MLCALIILGVVAADQLSKWLVLELLDKPVSIIPHILSFEYTTNTGMAWGLLKDQRWIFMTLSVLALVMFTYMYYRMVKNPHLLFTVSVGFIIGGGVGNMIDRLFREGGGVVDFFRTDFMEFPIFNVADVFITVGGFLIAGYFLFLDRKQPFPVVFEDKGDKNDGTDI